MTALKKRKYKVIVEVTLEPDAKLTDRNAVDLIDLSLKLGIHRSDRVNNQITKVTVISYARHFIKMKEQFIKAVSIAKGARTGRASNLRVVSDE